MMPYFVFFAGFWLGSVFATICMIVIILRTRKTPPPTLHHRRRNRDAPERNLFEELKEGMEELEAGRTGVDYRFINMTGEER